MSTEQNTNGVEKKQAASRGVRLGRWLLVGVLFLVLLPEIVRFALVQWFPSTGVGELSIDDVDLNLFDASAGLDGVVITRDGERKLQLKLVQLDISWLKLLLGQIHVERAVIDGLQLTASEMDDGNWEVVVPLTSSAATDKAAEPAAEKTPATGALPKILLREFDARNIVLTVDSSMVSGVFSVDSMQVENLSSWLPDSTKIELSARWQQAPVELSLSVSPWAVEPKLSGSLSIQSLPLDGFKPVAEEMLSGLFSTELKFSAEKAASGVVAAIEGRYGLSDFKTSYKNIEVEHNSLAWQGKVDLAQQPSPEHPLAFSVVGDIASRDFHLRDRRLAVELLHWQSLEVAGLHLDQANNVAVNSVTFAGIDLLDRANSSEHFHTESLAINHVQLLAGSRLHIDEVLLSQGDYDLLIDKQGKLQLAGTLTDVLAGFKTEQPTAQVTAMDASDGPPSVEQGQVGTEATKDDDTGLLVTLNKLQVQGNTRINFTDQRFSVPVKEALIIEDLTVEHLDQIDTDNEASLVLKARIGEFSSLQASGKAKPFADVISVSISGQLNAMELPVLSPYSEAYLGYHLSRGHYDHKFKVDVGDNKINFKNSLHLRQLKVEAVDPDKPQPLEKQLDVPLSLALDMLRDGEDNINLKVPIKGRLDDPNINARDVINTALAKGLKAGATSYLKLALQPYGAVLMAADFVGDQMKAIHLDPLLFEPGSNVLPEQLDYIGKLLGLLQQRPKLNLTVCGRSNQADSDVLQAAAGKPIEDLQTVLVQLAEQRAKNVKRQFLEKGIESKRVLLCQPQFAVDAVSGVQLAM